MYNPFYSPQNQAYQPQQFNVYGRQVFNAPQFVTKIVTSVEEARASLVDPLSTYLFIDTATGNIYMKRMNNNGLSDFFVYKVEDMSQKGNEDPLREISRRLFNIENILGGSNVQSVSGDAGGAESVAGNGDAVNVTDGVAESYALQPGKADDRWQVGRRD